MLATWWPSPTWGGTWPRREMRWWWSSRPSKQQVIKGDGSKKMTFSNEKLVRELEPRKTCLDAKPTTSNMTPPPVLVMKMRKMNTPFTTPQVTWRSSTASPSTSPQPTSPTQLWPVLSTESPVFGEFVRKNLEEEMYDSLLLDYAVTKPSGMPTWGSQLARSLQTTNVNTTPSYPPSYLYHAIVSGA